MEDRPAQLAPLPVPAVLPACLVLAAGAMAPATPAIVLAWLAVAALAAVAVAAVVLDRRHAHTRRRVAALALLVLVVGGGAALRLHELSRTALATIGAAAGSATVVAEVVGEPVRLVTGGWRSDVRVTAVDERSARQRAELRSDHPMRFGATLSGEVEVRAADGSWQTARHVAVVLHGDLDEVAPPGRLVAVTTAVREALRSAASDALTPARAGLATGLVTGDTSLLPEQDEEAMREVGLTHLTAVSGSNVAIVAAGIGVLAAVVGVGARGRRRSVVVALAVFLVLTRADPSVLRATAMAGVVLLAQATGRRVAGTQALAAAVVVLVVLDPLITRRLGLVLSAAATAGVLIVAPRLARRLRRWTGDGPVRRVGELLAVTLGAQVAVLPVLLAVGEEIRLATVPANLVAVPAAAVASVLCTVAAVVAVPLPGAAGVLLRCADVPLGIVLGAAHGLRWWGPALRPGDLLGVAVVLAAVVWAVAARRGRVARRAGVALAAGAVVVSSSAGFGRSADPAADGSFVLTAIDVGQGDAFLLRAGSARVLVDTGRDTRAARWLRGAGLGRIDLLVLTHADEDHTGGAVAVLDTVEVGALWHRPRDDAPPPALAAALARAAGAGVPVAAPAAGATATVGPLLVAVLAPADASVHRGDDSEENESSTVLRVDGPGGSVLLTGDTGPAAHRLLLRTPGAIDVDVVTVPHHGSADVDPSLVPATTPHTAVVSVGADNRYGHPTGTALDAVADAGAALRRTDREGTVHVEVAPPGVGAAVSAGRPAESAVGGRLTVPPHHRSDRVRDHPWRRRPARGPPRGARRDRPRHRGRRPLPMDGGPRRPRAADVGRRDG